MTANNERDKFDQQQCSNGKSQNSPEAFIFPHSLQQTLLALNRYRNIHEFNVPLHQSNGIFVLYYT